MSGEFKKMGIKTHGIPGVVDRGMDNRKLIAISGLRYFVYVTDDMLILCNTCVTGSGGLCDEFIFIFNLVVKRENIKLKNYNTLREMLNGVWEIRNHESTLGIQSRSVFKRFLKERGIDYNGQQYI